MTAGNAQENQDSDAEPDACVPGTYGCDSVPSVSKDYVPWLKMDANSFEGIIPEISKVFAYLLVTCSALATTTIGIRMVISSFDDVFLE